MAKFKEGDKVLRGDREGIVESVNGTHVIVKMPQGGRYKFEEDELQRVKSVKDSTTLRRARLHRALDCVLDRVGGRAKDADTRGAAARQLDDEYDNILSQISNLTEEYEEMESDWRHGRGSQSELNYMGRETTRMGRELDKLDKKKTAIEQKAKAAKIVLKKPAW